MKTPKGKEVFVFDNEGESFDRFTIVVKEDAMIFGASEHPFSPLGFGQFCGDVENTIYPLQDNLVENLDNLTDYYAELARKESSWLGKEITVFSELPEDVQKYVEQISE